MRNFWLCDLKSIICDGHQEFGRIYLFKFLNEIIKKKIQHAYDLYEKNKMEKQDYQRYMIKQTVIGDNC